MDDEGDGIAYDRYGAHGGDVGAMVCNQLCRDHEATVLAVTGCHLYPPA